MDQPQDAGKYQTHIDGTVQGQVTGDNNKVEMHFHGIQEKAPSPTKPQRAWNIPYLRNDYFTGREEILAQLHTRFKANNATALSQRHAMSGLGGIGKTQTAVEYAYRYSEEYQAVLWARAESHETLTSSFVEIATLLDLPQKDEQDQTMIVQAVKRWLQDNHGWLLILDNADEPKVIHEFLPTKFDGHILLTTRAQALGGLAQRIEVDIFTPELGALFLLRRATIIEADGAIDDAVQSDREIAVQISEELGGLPLALDQAGAYIEEVQCRLSDYLSLYRTRRAEVLKERGGLAGDHPDSVATTWSLSFQRVQERSEAAADLLRLCAFLAPDAIPEEIIIKGAEHLGPVLQTTANDPMALNKAIAALGAYSLIRRDPAEKTLSIHRLVQAVLRNTMHDEETKVWPERVVLAVNEACPDVEFVTWPQWERYLPHVLVCADLVKQLELTSSSAARLLFQTADYLSEHARYEQAESLLEQALQIRRQVLGDSHPDVATTFNNLAILYHDRGKYEQAEPLFEQALQIRRQVLGDSHPSVAGSFNNLALIYHIQGKHEQVKSLFEQVLQIIQINHQVLGIQHPDVAITLNNLALVYYRQGKYEQAKSLFEQALQIDRQALGTQHPYVATTLDNLAYVYYRQGKYEQAEPLFEQALQINRQVLGTQHPYLVITLGHLARLYKEQGKYEQAESLFEQALQINRQALGDSHPSVASSFNNLAELYQAQGKYGQAEPLYQHALIILERSLGPQHPDTQQARQNYAALLRAMGRNKEAKQIEEEQ